MGYFTIALGVGLVAYIFYRTYTYIKMKAEEN